MTSLIHSIAGKHPELAQTLHSEFVERLKKEDFLNNMESINVACNLLASFQPPHAKEESFRELVELVITGVLSVPPNSPRYSSQAQASLNQLSTVIANAEKYAPARVTALRHWSQRVRGSMEPSTRMYQDISEVGQAGSADEIIALAEKYPAELRMQIYQQAAWRAQNNSDMERARQIVNEYITDPVQRRQMLEQMDNQQVWKAVNENKILEARAALNKLKSVEQRAQILVSLASNLASRGSKEPALTLLDEAADLINTLPATSNRFTTQMQIIHAYADVDSSKSLAMMQPLIAQLNQLVTAASVLDGFETNFMKEGEWTRQSYSSLGNLILSVEQNIGMPARHDLEAAQVLSAQIERSEIRIFAQLEIAQAMIQKENSAGVRFVEPVFDGISN